MAYAQYTLADLETRLAARYESVPFWDQTEARQAINEALCTWNLLTGRWVTRAVMQTTPGEYEYVTPAPLSYRTRVLWNNQPLSPSSREDFNNGRPNWRQETTASGGAVPTQPTLWAPVSLELIYLWPADATGHNGLTLDGVMATPQLAAADQYVDLGQDDLSVLLGFCLHVLSYKLGSVWFQTTMPYFQAFLAAAGAENALITTSQIYRLYMGLDRRDLKPIRGTAPAAFQPVGVR
jgi:hypothetical protein